MPYPEPPSAHGARAASRAAPGRSRGGRARRRAARRVGRRLPPRRDGPERAAGRARRRRAAAARPARPRSARAPRARSTTIEPLSSLRGLEPALVAPGSRTRLRDRARARRAARGQPTCATRRCCPIAGWAMRCRRSGRRARRRAPWELDRVRAACAQGTAALQALPELVRVGRAEARRALRPRSGDAGPRTRGHGPLPRTQRRVLVRAGAGRPVGRRAGPDATRRSRRPGLSPAQGRGPSRRPLAAGDAIVVDVSGLAGGYVSDQTRTVFLGRSRPAARRRRTRPAARSCGPARSCSCPGTPASALYDRGLEVAARGRARGALHGLRARSRALRRTRDRARAERGPGARARRRMPRSSTARSSRSSRSSLFPGLGAVGIENSYVVRAGGTRAADARRRRLPIRVEP